MYGRYTFDRPRLRCIVQDTAGEDTRLLLLAETVQEDGMSCTTDLLCRHTVSFILVTDGDKLPETFKICGHLYSACIDAIEDADFARYPICFAELAHIREKVENDRLEIMPYDLPLDYSYFPTEHILKVREPAVCLPVACGTSAFTGGALDLGETLRTCMHCRGCCRKGVRYPPHLRAWDT